MPEGIATITWSDISLHIVGWLLAIVGSLAAMLYRGLWKAINALKDELDDYKSRMDMLRGEHNIICNQHGGHNGH